MKLEVLPVLPALLCSQTSTQLLPLPNLLTSLVFLLHA